MNIKHLSFWKQPGNQVHGHPDLKNANQLHSNLKKIISLSAGCTLLTGVANSDAAPVYACESIDDQATDCQTQKRDDVDAEVRNLNSPSVQQDLNVQWSTAQKDGENNAILVSDGAIAVDEEVVTEAEQAASENELEPLPTSTRLYGNTIDLQDSSTSTQILKRGARGDAVSKLQQKLNEAGINVNVDGIFGKNTQQAVRAFQKSQNLPQDGILGPKTSAALFGTVAPDNLSPTAGVPKADKGIQNIATASSQQTGFSNDDETVSIVSKPAVGINKSITQVFNPDGSPDDDGIVDQAGDMIRYSINVKNAGNVTLTGVTVDDPLTGGILTTDTTLAVGEEQSFDVSYTATQTDIDNNGAGLGFGLGSIDNEATVSSYQTGVKRDSESVPLKQTPALKVNKSAVGIDTKNDGRLNSAGDIIEYIIEVENTGNQTLTNVSVDDPQLGKRVFDQLAPGATQTFTARYRLTQADIDSNGNGDGDIDNTVEVTTTQTGPVKDFAEVDVEQNPDIKVEKRVLEQDGSGDGTLNNAGETVTYEVIVTNTGNQTLTNVSIQDSLMSSWIIRDLTLAPGASESYTYTYTITQGDLDNNLLAMQKSPGGI